MHPICERPSDLTIQSPGPVTNYLPLPLCVLRQRVGQGSRQVLTVAAAGPRSSSLVSYPSEQEVVKCSLWLQLVPEEEIRRWLGAYFTTIPVRKAAVQRSLWAQLLQENDVGRWSGTDFTAPTRPKKEAVKCSLGLQLVQEIPTSGVSHEQVRDEGPCATAIYGLRGGFRAAGGLGRVPPCVGPQQARHGSGAMARKEAQELHGLAPKPAADRNPDDNQAAASGVAKF
eukprot:s5962_g3.t1